MCSTFLPITTGFNIKLTKIEKPSILGRSNTLYVGGSGPNNYTRIQDAINDAVDGDTVYVYNNSSPYFENVFIDNSINLIGEDKDTTVIDADDWADVIQIICNRVNISGFTIQNNGDRSNDAGIDISSNNSNIYNNTIRSNKRYALFLWDSKNNTIKDNTFSLNSGYDIFLFNSKNNTIKENIFLDRANAIFLLNSSNNIVTSNNILKNDGNIGLKFDNSNYNTIIDNSVSNNFYGLFLENSNYTNIIDNKISNNFFGLLSIYSKNNNLIGNSFINDGLFLYNSYHNNLENNTVNDKPLVYLEDKSDEKITDAGQIILINCNNITAENLKISNTTVGIQIWGTHNSTIKNNDCSNNNEEGIKIDWNSKNNNIIGNTISYNYRGIWLRLSKNNNIINNNILNNNQQGIILAYSCDDNIIYHNNFINNGKNAHDIGNNIWDDGKYGNFWDDYKERYPEAKKKRPKGIWDTPYEILGGDNKDKFPLIKKWPNTKSRFIPGNISTFSSYLPRFINMFSIIQKLLSFIFLK